MGSVTAFDSKREEARLIDCPEFIDDCVCFYSKILNGRDIWLGMAQDLLTLVCIFRKCIVIATYNNASKNWRISHTLDKFDLDPYGIINVFPVWIDSKEVFFPGEMPLTQYHDLYEYDTKINGYKKVAAVGRINYPLHCFYPTLACVDKTPSDNAKTTRLSYIVAKLNGVRRYFTEGIFIKEDEEESSSEGESSLGEEEEIL